MLAKLQKEKLQPAFDFHCPINFRPFAFPLFFTGGVPDNLFYGIACFSETWYLTCIWGCVGK
jgi:hypothetical protein